MSAVLQVHSNLVPIFFNVKTNYKANDPHTPAATRAMLFGLSLRLIETAKTPSISSPDRFYLHLSILFEMGRLGEFL